MIANYNTAEKVTVVVKMIAGHMPKKLSVLLCKDCHKVLVITLCMFAGIFAMLCKTCNLWIKYHD